MHSLLTLIKALAITIALGAPTAAFANVSTPTTIPPADAPVVAPDCVTVDAFKESIINDNPGTVVVEIDPRGSITLSNPDYPTDLRAGFDENGCVFIAVEVPKTPKTGA